LKPLSRSDALWAQAVIEDALQDARERLKRVHADLSVYLALQRAVLLVAARKASAYAWARQAPTGAALPLTELDSDLAQAALLLARYRISLNDIALRSKTPAAEETDDDAIAFSQPLELIIETGMSAAGQGSFGF
jgi:hypothetical protein